MVKEASNYKIVINLFLLRARKTKLLLEIEIY